MISETQGSDGSNPHLHEALFPPLYLKLDVSAVPWRGTHNRIESRVVHPREHMRRLRREGIQGETVHLQEIMPLPRFQSSSAPVGAHLALYFLSFQLNFFH